MAQGERMLQRIGLTVALLLTGCDGAHAPMPSEKAGAVPTPVRPSPAEPASPVVEPLPATPGAEPAPDASLPSEVAAFRERRDECDHFRGEDPYDEERAAFLSEALTRTCTGTDAALKALRARYAGDPRVLAALADYEDEAE
ncbi:hypothetical protein [Sphingomonas desiccabilis]|uniref:hypothetical protein n=1 Tax=Sphingomonas desiccabilis TaxID=429134 RepID=UPI0017985823|nr:hypothetical protein [Sphingomonas desiccabilis]MBB3910176.1 hypothetical protein [Sphingomonas desiccabilis]